jgi:hypothetical protein
LLDLDLQPFSHILLSHLASPLSDSGGYEWNHHLTKTVFRAFHAGVSLEQRDIVTLDFLLPGADLFTALQSLLSLEGQPC